jgi:hypothetical protein
MAYKLQASGIADAQQNVKIAVVRLTWGNSDLNTFKTCA